ncbi:ferritin family protein [Candidatus Woesearchaeota archaeon]|nr:ferritin family protein [Candidatus Woesearchaeota archaeon]
MELKQALKTALDFEQKGKDIYNKTAEKTQNELVRKTFGYLAEQEQNHINEIKEFIKKESPDIGLLGDKPEQVKKFFTMTISEFKEKAEISRSDEQAYKTALELETSSYNFYNEQKNQSQDEQTKKFFQFLMDQEKAHYDFIEKSLAFVKDPGHFYQSEESWFFEGG